VVDLLVAAQPRHQDVSIEFKQTIIESGLLFSFHNPGTNICSSSFLFPFSVGHKGRFGHEFLEFELSNNGKLRYANDSKYKGDIMIRKELFVGREVVEQFKQIIVDSEITKEDDNGWPEPTSKGTQELEIIIGDMHVAFCTSKINSLLDVQEAADPSGLRGLYYVVQDLKQLALGLISLHFKVKPIPV